MSIQHPSLPLCLSLPVPPLVTSQVQYSQERLADAYELIGATFVDENRDVPTALSYWRQALLIRYSDPEHPIIKKRAEPNKVRDR